MLYSFDSFACGNFPKAPLIQASDGNLYGTTKSGGNDHVGAIFMVNPTTGAHYCVHGFSTNPTDGHDPEAGLYQAQAGPYAGLLIGTTTEGGVNHGGVLFASSLDGNTYSVLYNFCQSGGCADGKSPHAGVIEDSLGDFYGTTAAGGANGVGVVWELWLDPSGTYEYLVLNSLASTTGAYPAAPLVFGPPTPSDAPNDGYLPLYGTTATNGAGGYGTVFEVLPCVLPPDYTLNLPCPVFAIHNFSSGDGQHPHAPLMLSSDGYFYGTTKEGGNYGLGAVYRITPTASLYQVVYSFDSSQGSNPHAGLVQALNGYFYGTAEVDGSGTHGTAFNLSPLPEKFVAVKPCRLLDTRTTGTPLQPGVATPYNLRALAQTAGCEDLSHADSYALNVTLVPNYGPVGFVTFWPQNSPLGMPTASTTNAVDGVVRAATTIVQGGWDYNALTPHSGISIYSSDETDIIVDLQGYYSERQHVPQHGSTLQFYPLSPCRVVDTRQTTFPMGLGAPSLTGNVPRQFPMMTSGCFSSLGGVVPTAYSLNLTVVPQGPLGYLTAWAGGDDQPNVSNLNSLAGTVAANAAIVPAGDGADGAVKVYALNNTDLVIDVNGYFADPDNGNDYFSGLPCRAMDTRPNSFAGTLGISILASTCTPYVSPAAYNAMATVSPSGYLGYLTLFPSDQPQPVVSTLNSYTGTITSNMALVPNDTNIINAYASNSTNLILDLGGYFAPPSEGGGDTLIVKTK